MLSASTFDSILPWGVLWWCSHSRIARNSSIKNGRAPTQNNYVSFPPHFVRGFSADLDIYSYCLNRSIEFLCFLVPFPSNMSFPGQNRRAWDIYGPSYTNQTLPSDVRKVYAAGQLGKRTRSSSNEDFNSRCSRVQVWLKDQATAEDFEKVWGIFLGMPMSIFLNSLL